MNRTTLIKGMGLAPLLAVLAASGAAAHHSFAMFDQTKTVVLKGTVAEFQWTNPHAFIEMDVPGAGGKADRWGIELNSPNNLTRQGWKRNIIKAGDTVTVTINPLTNGSKGGLFNAIVLPDGSTLVGEHATNGQAINAPTAK